MYDCFLFVIRLVHDNLPPIAFPFTADLLKDAMRLFESPYGQVADTENISFPTCDCIDEKRNKPKRHNPCMKVSVVIVKSVYIEEEAMRREIEEDEMIERFKAIEEVCMYPLLLLSEIVLEDVEVEVVDSSIHIQC